MKNQQSPLIVIVGPTASGKSSLAVRLAKKFGGEIVSADSRQVYRRLDIGTGKISRRAMRDVPHHLLDVADPKRQFSVAEFQDRAQKTIAGIHHRGRMPFLVGGTAFWVDAVAYGIRLPRVAPDSALRKRLEKKTTAELFSLLKRIDPARARTVEQKNPRRLIRAIEIAKKIGRTPKVKRRRPYRVLWLGVSPPPATLQQRIRERLSKRLRQGMLHEAKKLRTDGLSWQRFYELGLEYRFLADHLRGNMTREQMISGLERAIRHYAQRQMRWWQRNKNIHWLDRPGDADLLVKTFIGTKIRKVRGARTG